MSVDFTYRLITLLKRKIKEVLINSQLRSEFDLQLKIIHMIKSIVENDDLLKIGNTIEYFNCIYLGEKNQTYFFPDLVIFNKCSLILIIEFKFYRLYRKFNFNEVKKDLEKLKLIINTLNEKKSKKKKTIIGLEIVVDTVDNNMNDIIKLASECSFHIIDENIKKDYKFGLLYDYIFQRSISNVLENEIEDLRKILMGSKELEKFK